MEGNQMKMREALELVNKIYDLLSNPCIVIEEVRHACQKARAVLIATPPRNCDVGTADEQDERFKNFCRSYYEPCNVDGECWKCPLFKTKTRCPIAWAQMPYEEEGGAK